MFSSGFGQVERVWSNQGEEGKTPFTRVTVRYSVTTVQGEPASRWAVLLAFGKSAGKFAELNKGEWLSFNGEAQAGRPYQTKKGDWSSQLEIRVATWQRLSFDPLAGSDPESEGEGTPRPAAAAVPGGTAPGGTAPQSAASVDDGDPFS